MGAFAVLVVLLVVRMVAGCPPVTCPSGMAPAKCVGGCSVEHCCVPGCAALAVECPYSTQLSMHTFCWGPDRAPFEPPCTTDICCAPVRKALPSSHCRESFRDPMVIAAIVISTILVGSIAFRVGQVCGTRFDGSTSSQTEPTTGNQPSAGGNEVEVKVEVVEESEVSSELDTEGEARENAPTCPVCLDPCGRIIVLAPCGHVVCRGCCRYLPRTKTCPICRAVIESHVRKVFVDSP
eukprot:Sspe_Gene.36538::Locus_17657_Transcript_1_1_Confidence_1.000_Length_1019::g.36538::m.36538